ncbi:hypothetical protein [Enterobacter pseudoroggenkampii]|uniref:hypothetical protein n=1 Tax=Enterobacter pseudoroggenkampii TaxID=2996112 RepID=UPI002264923E|nr:hypothetical protein [Enterobacter pseudoroggenkampii]MCX8289090.1 hypothetical protein [Enterobacter pseudoroggenkampii]
MNDEQKKVMGDFISNITPKRSPVKTFFKWVGVIIGVLIALLVILGIVTNYIQNQRTEKEMAEFEVNNPINEQKVIKYYNDLHDWIGKQIDKKDGVHTTSIDTYAIRLADVRKIRIYRAYWDSTGTSVTGFCATFNEASNGCRWSSFTTTLKEPLGGVTEVLVGYSQALSEDAVRVILKYEAKTPGLMINITTLDGSQHWTGREWQDNGK